MRALVACLGMAVLDRIFAVPHLPAGPTKLYATAVLEVGGGPASTAAAAIVKLGGAARLFARLGEDAVGAAILQGLRADGIDTAGIRSIAGAASAWSAVALEPGGERLILNTPGHGLDVPPDWIGPDALHGASAVLVDMGWPAGASRLLGLARQARIPSVLDADLSPHPEAADLIDQADHVVFSAEGLARHAATPDPAEGLRRIAARDGLRANTLGVTLGARGAIFLHGGAFLHTPALPIHAIDTLGAGDVFHGAYALALAETLALPQAIQFAATAAAIKCTRPGGRLGIPTRAELTASDPARPAERPAPGGSGPG